MMVVRRATRLDTRQMAELLNQIIRAGGTTAIVQEVTRDDLWCWVQSGGDRAAWHVAESSDGSILGFQWIAPNSDLPTEVCEIATFVQTGKTGLGTGSRLFDATKAAAGELGYAWIHAEIRADNSGGLAYYQSRGFETYGHRTGVVLSERTRVDKVLKRFELDPA